MKKRIQIMQLAVTIAVNLVWAGGATAILIEDYVAIRILEPSDPRPVPDDPEGCRNQSRQNCVAIGPAYAAGISDAGDVFGHMETNHPHEHHWEAPIRWLRGDKYKGDFLGTFPLDGELWPCAIDGRTRGLHARWVSPDGIATGKGNPGIYHIDIASGEVTIVGLGVSGQKASGNLVITWEAANSEAVCATDPRVTSVSDVSLIQPPFAPENRGVVHEIGSTQNPTAINDRGVIVGYFDPSCIDFPGFAPFCSGQSLPMKIEPTGDNQWGPVVAMEELREESNGSRVLDLSNTDPGFAIGTSEPSPNQRHGVIWNTVTGEIVQDLGVFNLPHRINSTGDIIAGTRQNNFFTPKEPVIWSSDDQWQTVNVLTIQEIMDAIPGGEHWAELSLARQPPSFGDPHNMGSSSPIAVNAHGQLLVMGTMFEEAPIEELTQWPRDIATGATCSDDRYPCGIPFILDPLVLSLLIGDVNRDSAVNNLDITPFIAALAAADEAAFLTQFPSGNYAAADIDMSGSANNLDITPFIGLLTAAGSNATAVPEPSSLVCVALVLMMGRRRRPT